MKQIKILIILLSFTITTAWAQDAESAFHQAAGQYVKGSIMDARTTVASALQKYPNDPKLNSLMEKLKKENPENKQQPKDGEENEDKNPEEKDPNKEESEDSKEGENKDKDESEDNKEGESEENAEENKEGEKGEKEEQRSRSEKLQQMNLTEEKALSILEAMKNSEIQYIQQNKRKIRENANYGKPDW